MTRASEQGGTGAAAPETRRTLVIGTRGSALALWQAEHVADRLSGTWPGLEVRLERIRTTGDKILDVPLAAVGGKALFVKEIEEALLDGRVDLAVHSLKDVPAELPAGLTIAATPEREDPSDVLICRTAARFAHLPRGARVGTSSLRRQAQLLHLRPDLEVIGLRGNLDTRVRKLDSEGLDAIVLAHAGVKRLGLERVVTEVFGPDMMLPAVGQGVLAIESREPSRAPRADSREGRGDQGEMAAGHAGGGHDHDHDHAWLSDVAVTDIVAVLDHRETGIAMRAERAFLRRLGGGCQVPIAALARIEGDSVRVSGLVATVDGRTVIRGESHARCDTAEAAGAALADDLLGRGGAAILARIVGKGRDG